MKKKTIKSKILIILLVFLTTLGFSQKTYYYSDAFVSECKLYEAPSTIVIADYISVYLGDGLLYKGHIYKREGEGILAINQDGKIIAFVIGENKILMDVEGSLVLFILDKKKIIEALNRVKE